MTKQEFDEVKRGIAEWIDARWEDDAMWRHSMRSEVYNRILDITPAQVRVEIEEHKHD